MKWGTKPHYQITELLWQRQLPLQSIQHIWIPLKQSFGSRNTLLNIVPLPEAIDDTEHSALQEEI
jgi:hypothetical protein